MNFFKSDKNQTVPSIQLLILGSALLFGTLSRFIFLGFVFEPMPFADFFSAFLRGIVFDSIVGLYFILPIAPFGFLPNSIWKQPGFQRFLYSLFFLMILLLSLASASEIFFVEEFRSRFNFIAVDYLVYTNEVIKNIWESYPLSWILPLYLFLVFAISRLAFTNLTFSFTRWNEWKLRIPFSCLPFVLSGFFYFTVSETNFLEGRGSVSGEFSKNPIHALFSAYGHNEIDYEKFYPSISRRNLLEVIHEAMNRAYQPKDLNSFSNNTEEKSIVKNIVHTGSPKKLNVVLVLMESMSARFLKTYGADKSITPNLDALIDQGLSFERMYSTGTRTVRGIEAVMLSIPPTPGQSIVRRPGNENLFTLGSVFRNYGYKNQFIYGGEAFFDNMREFFHGNGFEVLDKTNMSEEEIGFANAWGVCDENLFEFALKNADKNHSEGNPFFQLVLTTSNHRPYTFPEARIDLKSRTGRDGAVKYADYAVGKFISDAKKKPWFHDTVFIFVADHNASVAGGTKVLPSDFHIPMIFYSPAHIKPKTNRTLGSQIDLGPTLFGILNFSYQSRFFGHDLQKTELERAFIGTYQKVGLWQGNRIVLLSPNHRVEIGDMNGEMVENLKEFHQDNGKKISDPNLLDTIGYYQSASFYFRENLLKEGLHFPETVNRRPF